MWRPRVVVEISVRMPGGAFLSNTSFSNVLHGDGWVPNFQR
jgi:hypothetical protein